MDRRTRLRIFPATIARSSVPRAGHGHDSDGNVRHGKAGARRVGNCLVRCDRTGSPRKCLHIKTMGQCGAWVRQYLMNSTAPITARSSVTLNYDAPVCMNRSSTHDVFSGGVSRRNRRCIHGDSAGRNAGSRCRRRRSLKSISSPGSDDIKQPHRQRARDGVRLNPRQPQSRGSRDSRCPEVAHVPGS